MIFRLLFAFILIAPFVSFIAWSYFYVKKTQASSVRPFSNNTPRPPGESLRLKVEDLNLDALAYLMLLTFIAVFGIMLLFQSSSGGKESVSLWMAYSMIGIIIGCSIAGILIARKLKSTLLEMRSYSLGFDGERHVGQALNRLMLKGFTVYHDVQFENAGKTFNIDHVVVGDQGIYAVETKTRRKPMSSDKMIQYRVKYDGKRLTFPNGSTSAPIAQALANAKFLSRWLSGKVGKDLSAKPIIIIPGWWIEASTQKPVVVMTDRNIETFHFRANASLDAQTRRQVDFALNEHNSESLN